MDEAGSTKCPDALSRGSLVIATLSGLPGRKTAEIDTPVATQGDPRRGR
jgi:hypothetical protein